MAFIGRMWFPSVFCCEKWSLSVFCGGNNGQKIGAPSLCQPPPPHRREMSQHHFSRSTTMVRVYTSTFYNISSSVFADRHRKTLRGSHTWPPHNLFHFLKQYIPNRFSSAGTNKGFGHRRIEQILAILSLIILHSSCLLYFNLLENNLLWVATS